MNSHQVHRYRVHSIPTHSVISEKQTDNADADPHLIMRAPVGTHLYLICGVMDTRYPAFWCTHESYINLHTFALRKSSNEETHIYYHVVHRFYVETYFNIVEPEGTSKSS